MSNLWPFWGSKVEVREPLPREVAYIDVQQGDHDGSRAYSEAVELRDSYEQERQQPLLIVKEEGTTRTSGLGPPRHYSYVKGWAVVEFKGCEDQATFEGPYFYQGNMWLGRYLEAQDVALHCAESLTRISGEEYIAVVRPDRSFSIRQSKSTQ